MLTAERGTKNVTISENLMHSTWTRKAVECPCNLSGAIPYCRRLMLSHLSHYSDLGILSNIQSAERRWCEPISKQNSDCSAI